MTIPTLAQVQKDILAAIPKNAHRPRGDWVRVHAAAVAQLLNQIVTEVNRLGKCCPADGSKYTALANLPHVYAAEMGGGRKTRRKLRRRNRSRRRKHKRLAKVKKQHTRSKRKLGDKDSFGRFGVNLVPNAGVRNIPRGPGGVYGRRACPFCPIKY